MGLPLWFAVPGFFLGVVASVGNGMVVFLITTKRRLHTTANWFILSLAVADFGSGVLVFPRSLVCDIEKKCGFTRNGGILPLLLTFFCCGTALNLWAMTFDRYIAIVKPLRYITLMTTRRVVTIVAMAWMVSVFIATMKFFIVVVMAPGQNQSTALGIFSFATGTIYFLCASFLAVATGHILHITRKHSQQIATIVAQLNFNQPENAPIIRVNTSTQESASARLITTVVLLNLAYLIGGMIAFGCPENQLCTTFRPVGALLIVANSAVNPVVYALLKRDIRGELRRMFARSVSVSH